MGDGGSGQEALCLHVLDVEAITKATITLCSFSRSDDDLKVDDDDETTPTERGQRLLRSTTLQASPPLLLSSLSHTHQHPLPELPALFILFKFRPCGNIVHLDIRYAAPVLTERRSALGLWANDNLNEGAGIEVEWMRMLEMLGSQGYRVHSPLSFLLVLHKTQNKSPLPREMQEASLQDILLGIAGFVNSPVAANGNNGEPAGSVTAFFNEAATPTSIDGEPIVGGEEGGVYFNQAAAGAPAPIVEEEARDDWEDSTTQTNTDADGDADMEIVVTASGLTPFPALALASVAPTKIWTAALPLMPPAPTPTPVMPGGLPSAEWTADREGNGKREAKEKGVTLWIYHDEGKRL
ncbi:hypothetical protein R3P38DRAFT_2808097 [Favolaschia claudopus]|uniref:Mediator of RNA polymerase II transcription subunit 13 n=1 Tax=Favolaschia claudopus TaxID=2862362 RepID=A0AAV9ZHW8_9AGAR